MKKKPLKLLKKITFLKITNFLKSHKNKIKKQINKITIKKSKRSTLAKELSAAASVMQSSS